MPVYITGSSHPDDSVYAALEEAGAIVVSEDHDAGDAETWRGGRKARQTAREGAADEWRVAAAEWAECWMGALRRRLWQLGGGDASPAPLLERPHLVFFLHDELIVHTPAELAEQVADALRESAAEAGRILFGSAPVEFSLTVAIVDDYAQAK